MKTAALLLLLLIPVSAINAVYPRPVEEVMPASIVFTKEERIVAVLKDSGYSREMQRIILAQAKHESGEFTNPLTVKHNNLFAMRHPKRRSTLSLGAFAEAEGRGGYASYSSIDSAVADYILYMRFAAVQPMPDAESYITQLKNKKYFTDRTSRYFGGVAYFMKRDSTVRNFSTN